MAREIGKELHDETTPGLKKWARMFLIRSISNGQNNAFTGKDDIWTIFNL